MHINLLPDDLVARQAARRQLRLWGMIIAAQFAVAGALCGRELLQMHSCQQEIRQALLKHPGLRQLATETQLWEQRLFDAQACSDAIRKLRTDKRALALIGLIARSANDAGGKTRIQRVNITIPSTHGSAATAQLPQATPGGAPPASIANNNCSMILEGLAEDTETVSRFVENLREPGVLTQVNLKGSSESTANAAQCRQFQIECNF